jgi:hypothetical protein
MFRGDLEHNSPVPATPDETFAAARSRRQRVEHGDWQTPPALAGTIMELVGRLEPRARAVLEPTCGKGAFLTAARRVWPQAALRGFELSAEYAALARRALRDENAEIAVADFFQTPWEAVLARLPEPFVITGNPPWVTSSTLGAITGTNQPVKSNFKGQAGLAALTGKSNFDISEWMLARLLEAARGRRFTLAMLCKASVARKLLERASVERWPLAGVVRTVDARAHFSAAVSAVLLVLRPAVVTDSAPSWDLYPSLEATVPASRMALRRGRVTSDVLAHERSESLEGASDVTWRSGVKHDLAAVMELRRESGVLYNGLGEPVSIEPDCVYPLLKGSELANGRATRARYVLVTQTRLGDDTRALESVAPLTWRYLMRHRARFAARKSRVYARQPPFAMFGVGAYSFAPYKVAVSGLHKRLAFRVVGPRDGRPVMLDDTSYFLPCADASEAERLVALLCSEPAREFFEARVFWDDMRPINKALLGALSLEALARALRAADGRG